MRVRLTLNIGTHAARDLGLAVTREGSVADVSERAADFMLRKGWAKRVDVPEAEMPVMIHAVPDVDVTAEPDIEPTMEPDAVEDDVLEVGDEADDESTEIDEPSQPRRRRGRPRKDGR